MRIDVFAPDLQRMGDRVDALDALLGEVGPDVVEVPNQQVECIVVVSRIDRLRKVDDRYGIVPVEHVVGRKIGVNAVLPEEDLDILEDSPVDFARLADFEIDIEQHRGRMLGIPDVFHQDHWSDALEWLGDIGPRIVEELQGPHLVGDPSVELVGLGTARLLAEGAKRPRIRAASTLPPLLVDSVSLETPPLDWSIDLRGDEIMSEGRIGATAVDDGLLPALDRADDLVDQMILEEWIEMRQEDLLDGQVLLLRVRSRASACVS